MGKGVPNEFCFLYISSDITIYTSSSVLMTRYLQLAWGVLVAGEGSDEDGRGRVHLKAALMLG